MLVVDAQIHIWRNNKPTNANHRQVTDFTAADVLKEMDEGGVARRHPSARVGSRLQRARGRGRAPASQPARDPRNFPLDKPESRTLIDGLKSRPGNQGAPLRAAAAASEDVAQRRHPRLAVPAAERAGLPVALLGPGLLQVIGRIAERHAGLKLIIDHFGRPDAAWSNLPELVAAAKHRNVALKATGAPSYSGAAYPYRDIHGHIRKLYDAFGPERMFWGTDITRCPARGSSASRCSPRAAVALGEGQELIMGARALRLARLENPGIGARPGRATMADDELKSEVERLKAENRAEGPSDARRVNQGEREGRGLRLRLGRFPVTLYKEQWPSFSHGRRPPRLPQGARRRAEDERASLALRRARPRSRSASAIKPRSSR